MKVLFLIIFFCLAFLLYSTLTAQVTHLFDTELGIPPYGVKINVQTRDIIYYDQERMFYSNTSDIELLQQRLREELIFNVQN